MNLNWRTFRGSDTGSDTLRTLEKKLEALEKENQALKLQVEYLYWWAIRSDENIRDTVSKIGGLGGAETHTKEIFKFKWEQLNKGIHSLENPQHRKQIKEVALRWTGLPEEWFPGKQVLDAGCGDGRLSYGLCLLGAHVTSMDQSAKGVERTVEYCRDFENHKGVVWDLLEPYNAQSDFDLVLSFGVVHCTGDTRRAVANLARLVMPRGYFALMVYGYPRLDNPGDFLHMVRKEKIRQAIRHMDHEDAVRFINDQIEKHGMPGDARGWFDATAPRVEDHYTYPQVAMMLGEQGFENILLLDQTIRNLAVRSQKKA